jgi:hypothetical protein
LASKLGSYRNFKIMVLGLWTFLPEGQVPIIDPAAIDLSEHSPIPLEDSRFGRDAYACKMDQGLPFIEQCGLTDSKVTIVLRD